MEEAAGERVRVGVVGGGLVAQAVHLPHLHDLGDRFAVAGLAEPDARRREWLAGHWRIPLACAGHEELIERGGLDAVLVCSPNGTHAQVVLAALAAGLHVLVEKPLCITAADASCIVAARDRCDRVVQVGYMKRFDPAYEALVEDVRGARERILHLATLTYDPELAPAFAPAGAPPASIPTAAGPDSTTAAQVAEAVGSEHPADAARFSDVFLGALVHDVNLAHGILDAAGTRPGAPVDAFAAPDGSAAGGAVALGGGARWTMAWLRIPGLGDFRERVELFTDAGVRALEFAAPYLRQAPTAYRHSAGAGGANVARALRSWRGSYATQLLHFHDCVTRGLACLTPPEQAARDIALLTALYREQLGAGAAGRRAA